MSQNNCAPGRPARGAILKPMCGEDTPAQHRSQLSDDEREQRIDILRLQLLGAASPSDRHRLFAQLRDEIARRSPAAIERLERAHSLLLGGH